MRLVVKHVTRYTYEQPIAHMIQQLRLTPHSQEGQEILSWTVSAPGLETGAHYTDGFGNRVDLVSHNEPVTELSVSVEGLVETRDMAGLVSDFPCPATDDVFRRFTPLTETSPAIRRLGALAADTDDISGFHDLMQAIRDKVDYQTGVTEVHTTGAEALTAGQGVCQDHAHIFISAARSIGVPARYVSGYMLMEDEQESEAHHAWAEVKLPTLGWVGFDVSNGMCPTERYIRLTTGLDSRSAAPIRGVRRGSGDETMTVEVAVLQESAQAQQQ